MSAELSELLSSPITHSYLAGLPIPHSSCSHHTLLRSPTLTLTPLNLNTWFHLLLLKTLGLSSMNPLHFPPLCLQIYWYLYSLGLHFASKKKNPYSLVHLTFWFHCSCLCQDLVSSMCFLFSVQPLTFFQHTNLPEFSYFVKKRSFFPSSTVKLLFSFPSYKDSWQRTLHSMALLT